MSAERWIWRHFGLSLPADWELLQFVRNPAQGRCAFADRYGFRLEFAWRAVAGPPDFDRMMGDYAAKLGTQGVQRLRRERRAGWAGLAGEQQDRPVSRFGAYFDRESCVTELVFLWPGERSTALEGEVLASFGEEPADAAGRRRWRAFGLDLRVAGALDFAACRVEPGLADLRFAGARGRPAVRFRRLGLRPAWMRVDVAAWLRAQAPDWRAVREWAERRDGHEVFRRAGRPPAGALERLRGPVLAGAEAWVCPADDRLYVREWRGRAAFAEGEASGGALRCAGCGGPRP